MKLKQRYMNTLNRMGSKNTGAHFTVSFRKIFRR